MQNTQKCLFPNRGERQITA
uniref:Uncharacterized protein n=1 Tax=Anguilla anguilla TaxID=7936 RepID=A0A0E9XTV5_ANGAN